MSRSSQHASRILVDCVVPFEDDSWCRVAYRELIDPRDGRERPELFIEMNARFSNDPRELHRLRFPLTQSDARGFLKQLRHLRGFIGEGAGSGRVEAGEHGIFPFHRFYFGWTIAAGRIARTVVSATAETLGTAELTAPGRDPLEELEKAFAAIAKDSVRPHGPSWHERLLDIFAQDLFRSSGRSPAR